MFSDVCRSVGLTVVLSIIAFALVAQPAQAQSMTEVLARMDAIIAEMQALRAEFAALSVAANASTPAPSVLGVVTTKTLTYDLSYGVTNEDIARIQRLLATDPLIYPYGVDSGYFGPKTQEAIRQFQIRMGLDPVGVIGPATTALLEVFLNAYPDENYPNGVLANKPQVLGAQTSTPAPTVTTYTPTATIGAARSIDVEIDRGEAEVKIVYTNGNKRTLYVNDEDEDDIIDNIVSRTPLSESDVRAVIEFDGGSKKRGDADEGDAEDALDDADDAIDDADNEIEDADDDGEDVDWAEDTLDDAKDLLEEAEDAFDDEDYDEAVELAEEAEDLAEKAEDRIGDEKRNRKGEKDEIDLIVAEVDDDESEITVEYEDDDDYVFTIEEDKKDEIIEEVADELNIDEDDVEDLIEFDFGDVEEIGVIVDDFVMSRSIGDSFRLLRSLEQVVRCEGLQEEVKKDLL